MSAGVFTTSSLAKAAKVQPGADKLLFLPYMMGERAPIWASRAQGTLLGLSLNTTRSHVVRAILEGVAFGLCHNTTEANKLGLRVCATIA